MESMLTTLCSPGLADFGLLISEIIAVKITMTEITCICFAGGKAERECWIEYRYASSALGMLMTSTMELQSLMIETKNQSLQ